MPSNSLYSERLSDLEALLFSAGDPIAVETLAALLDIDSDEVIFWLGQLASRYRRDETTSLRLAAARGRYYLSTKSEKSELLAGLFRPQHRPALSQAAYEVLAVVAYNERVTRAQIEEVRGVKSDSPLMRLVERGYVESVGYDETPGHPELFAVTETFLREFGLSSTDDLPAVDLLKYETVEQFSRQFEEQPERSDEEGKTPSGRLL
jgi:segregation and condensation protein B